MSASPSPAAGGSGRMRLVDAANERVVEFYETERFLVDSVTEYVGQALRQRQAAIVIATAPHTRAFEASLEAAGIDLAQASAGGRYLVLDGAETLAKFMIGERLDAGRFRDTIAPLIERAATAASDVRIYSELVSLLWGQRNVAATITLGDLWRSLELTHDFTLLCAYPMRAFASEDSNPAFEAICAQHNAVIPSDPYPSTGSTVDQRRAVAQLQREVVALRSNIAKLRAEHERLNELAHVDVVTGLGNRRAFDRHLQREWDLSKRNRYDSAIVLADLDRFKEYNDEHGHAAGDDILREFAAALHSAARSTDILCRVGGDEFAAILINCRQEDCELFIDRVRRIMDDPSRPRLANVVASLGYASFAHAQSPAEAFQRADNAMYSAKQSSGSARRRRPQLFSLKRSGAPKT